MKKKKVITQKKSWSIKIRNSIVYRDFVYFFQEFILHLYFHLLSIFLCVSRFRFSPSPSHNQTVNILIVWLVKISHFCFYCWKTHKNIRLRGRFLIEDGIGTVPPTTCREREKVEENEKSRRCVFSCYFLRDPFGRRNVGLLTKSTRLYCHRGGVKKQLNWQICGANAKFG